MASIEDAHDPIDATPAYVQARDAVGKILRHLKLPDTPLPLGKARGPPQQGFDW